jgi:hypothetical protein
MTIFIIIVLVVALLTVLSSNWGNDGDNNAIGTYASLVLLLFLITVIIKAITGCDIIR